MKRLFCLLIAMVLMCSGCVLKDPEEQLYEHYKNKEAEFTLYAKDANEAFVQMFASHPEQLVHLSSVSIQPGAFSQKVKVEYLNTDINAEEILCGTEEEVAVKAMERSLLKGAQNGMMVLQGDGQPNPELYSKQLSKTNYLATMGLKSSQWQMVTNDFTKDVVVNFVLEYHEDTETVLKYRAQVKKEIDALSKKLWSEKDDAEKRVRAIHDYIIKETKYTEKNSQIMLDHTPYGPLLKGRGVCDGYTYTAKLLLDAAGIENEVVGGKAGGEDHSWNMVKLSETYYHMDVTWDDPVDPSGKDRLIYDYYLKSDAYMRDDHTWKTEDLPTCPKNYK